MRCKRLTSSYFRSNLLCSLIVGCGIGLVTSSALGSVGNTDARLAELSKQVKIEKIDTGIRTGDRSVFSDLPAKGYKDGVSGLLKRYKLYVNPAYSFTQCDSNSKITAQGGAPGCVVSLKFAHKDSSGKLTDIGIRAEWSIGLGEKKFQPNNSTYAEHITRGDGVVDAMLAN